MTDLQPTTETSIDGYNGNSIPWTDAEQRIRDNPAAPGQSYWIATTSPDGRPHVMPVGALWIDGAFYFSSGPGTRKSRNIAQNQHVVVTAVLPGLDLVVEGEAAKITDDATLNKVAAVFGASGWGPTVRDGAFYHDFSAPSAGPPPWELYQVTPTKAFGLSTEEPYGATRWTFES
ncbi:MAG TPA: pyridoxamine 5'-phosphate oxidase family protein [Acidimicrobiales bacterium]|jgi:hypothetical protein